MGGAARRRWTSSPPRMWESWCAEDDAGSEASEWERREREEKREAEGGAGYQGGTPAVPIHAFRHGVRRRGVGDELLLPFVIPFV